MEIAFNIVYGLHMIGFLAIGWGLVSGWKTKGINAAMLHGASTQLATGVVMVGLGEAGAIDESFNTSVVGIKLLVVIAILAAVMKGRRAVGSTKPWWLAVTGLWVLNIVLSQLISS